MASRDVSEPQTLYLWDAAARAELTYRNYGEFIATLSEADVAAIKANRAKTYPDISPTVSAFPTKKSLEQHFSTSFRNFDMDTPDAMTLESYRLAKESGGRISPVVHAAGSAQPRWSLKDRRLVGGIQRVRCCAKLGKTGSPSESFNPAFAERSYGRTQGREANASVLCRGQRLCSGPVSGSGFEQRVLERHSDFRS